MAKRFQFRLEPVLRLRTHKVNEAKEELGSVMRKRMDKEQKLADKQNYFSDLLTDKTGQYSAAELQAQISHENAVKEEIIKLENEKEQLLEIESFKREKLTVAMKEEKILEKLKERKLITHNENISKEEMKVLDELAITGSLKKEKY
jgi:flagellar export protein FliJ